MPKKLVTNLVVVYELENMKKKKNTEESGEE